MDMKILHLYPDLMNLYGEWANVAAVRRQLEDLGNTVAVEAVSLGGTVDFTGVDFVFLGAGTERSQKAVRKALEPYGPALVQAAKSGTVMLFTGTAFDLLGREITDAAGEQFPGLGLGDFTVQETDKRIVGDVYGPSPLAGETVVGFMNKCSHVSGVTAPLLTRCDMGFGNDALHGPEGYWTHHVLGTHLTGPVLVKNPALTRALIGCIYIQRGETPPAVWPKYPEEEQGYQVTITELKKLGDKA